MNPNQIAITPDGKPIVGTIEGDKFLGTEQTIRVQLATATVPLIQVSRTVINGERTGGNMAVDVSAGAKYPGAIILAINRTTNRTLTLTLATGTTYVVQPSMSQQFEWTGTAWRSNFNLLEGGSDNEEKYLRYGESGPEWYSATPVGPSDADDLPDGELKGITTLAGKTFADEGGAGTGATTGEKIARLAAPGVAALTAKTTLVDADLVEVSDSAATNAGKKATMANFLAYMRSATTGAVTAGYFPKYASVGGSVGIAAQCISFPGTQVASSDANALDDYEEGDWTPVLAGAATAGTYEIGTNYSRYTKIGNKVILTLDITLSGTLTGGGSGDVLVSGQPYSRVSLKVFYGISTSASGFTQIPSYLFTYATTQLKFSYPNAGAVSTYIQPAEFVAGKRIVGSVTYETA